MLPRPPPPLGMPLLLSPSQRGGTAPSSKAQGSPSSTPSPVLRRSGASLSRASTICRAFLLVLYAADWAPPQMLTTIVSLMAQDPTVLKVTCRLYALLGNVKVGTSSGAPMIQLSRHSRARLELVESLLGMTKDALASSSARFASQGSPWRVGAAGPRPGRCHDGEWLKVLPGRSAAQQGRGFRPWLPRGALPRGRRTPMRGVGSLVWGPEGRGCLGPARLKLTAVGGAAGCGSVAVATGL